MLKALANYTRATATAKTVFQWRWIVNSFPSLYLYLFIYSVFMLLALLASVRCSSFTPFTPFTPFGWLNCRAWATPVLRLYGISATFFPIFTGVWKFHSGHDSFIKLIIYSQSHSQQRYTFIILCLCMSMTTKIKRAIFLCCFVSFW